MVVGTRRTGLSISQTADLLGFFLWTTISRVYREWSEKEKISSERQLCGWRCLVDVRGQRRMDRLVRDDRKTTVTQITTRYNQDLQNTISEHTTHRTLKQMDFSSRRPHRVPLRSDKNSTRRIQFTQTQQNWTIEDWKNVAWSDESRFLLQHSDDRIFMTTVYHLLMYFQQDNAPCHKAQIISDWFLEHDNEFTLLKCPPQSPDLNPIEHLWDVVEREIHIMDVQTTNLQRLCDAIMTIWTNISEECFQHLVESMPRRIKAVLKTKGVQPGTSKMYLIKWPVSVCVCVCLYIYIYFFFTLDNFVHSFPIQDLCLYWHLSS